MAMNRDGPDWPSCHYSILFISLPWLHTDPESGYHLILPLHTSLPVLMLLFVSLCELRQLAVGCWGLQSSARGAAGWHFSTSCRLGYWFQSCRTTTNGWRAWSETCDKCLQVSNAQGIRNTDLCPAYGQSHITVDLYLASCRKNPFFLLGTTSSCHYHQPSAKGIHMQNPCSKESPAHHHAHVEHTTKLLWLALEKGAADSSTHAGTKL